MGVELGEEPLENLQALRSQWGVPDWKIESEYRYTAHDHSKPLINDQLRWEFLRRNPAYRDSWQHDKTCRSVFGLIEPINPQLRGDQLGNRTVLFIDSVMRGSMISLAAPKRDLESDYKKSFGEFAWQLEQDGFLVLGFDPMHPTRPQIERAEDILNHLRGQLERRGESIKKRDNPIEHPSLLLRTLDAHNEGATPLEIGQIIYYYTAPDAAGVAEARTIATERLNAARSCWERISPIKDNVRL